jgi:hypothetical protein
VQAVRSQLREDGFLNTASETELRALHEGWLWDVATAAAKVIGREAAKEHWSVNRRKNLWEGLFVAATKAAQVEYFEPAVRSQLRKSEEWHGCEAALLRSEASASSPSRAAPEVGGESPLPGGDGAADPSTAHDHVKVAAELTTAEAGTIATGGHSHSENERAASVATDALGANSDTSTQETIEKRPGNARKGDWTLLGEKRLVSFETAEQYLGISERQRQRLIKSGALKVEGQGQNRKITAESLKAYLPPEIPT